MYEAIMVYRISRNIDSDFNLANCVKIAKLTYIINLQAWISLHAEPKPANLKSCQQHFLSKPPNITLTNISGYTVSNVL